MLRFEFKQLVTLITVLFQLAPRCQDYILKCSLSNIDIPCFTEAAFQESLTKYGPCCTFNTQNR